MGGAGGGARRRRGEAFPCVQVSVLGEGYRLRVHACVDSGAPTAAGGGARARSALKTILGISQGGRRRPVQAAGSVSRRQVRVDGSAGWHLQSSQGTGRLGGCGCGPGFSGFWAGPALLHPGFACLAQRGRWEGMQDVARLSRGCKGKGLPSW